MTTLAFYPAKSHAGDGYNVFAPESAAFIKVHGGQRFEIEAIKMQGIVPVAAKAAEYKKRRDEVIAAMQTVQTGSIDTVAFFCHGWKNGMQFGFDARTAPALATELMRLSTDDEPMTVVLYSCSCGDGGTDGDGGFADALRDALCKEGEAYCRVFAHTNPGHATRNPYVRVFDGGGSSYGGTGGSWIVAPKSELWAKWRAALKGPLRLRYPMMLTSDIHDAVAKVK